MENTVAAFDAALQSGFDQIETDLRTTADGHIVLHHDPDMRHTSGQQLVIERIELRQFRAATYHDGQQGLTFEQFAERYCRLPWILDIKPEGGERTLHALADWADRGRKREWLRHHARFLLWRADQAKLLQSLLPGAVTMAGAAECRRAGVACLCHLEPMAGLRPGRTYSLPPRFFGLNLFDARLAARYHQQGARLLAYLPDSEREVAQALTAGFDEILLDRPLAGLPQQT